MLQVIIGILLGVLLGYINYRVILCTTKIFIERKKKISYISLISFIKILVLCIIFYLMYELKMILCFFVLLIALIFSMQIFPIIYHRIKYDRTY
jgi:hypothetical protein